MNDHQNTQEFLAEYKKVYKLKNKEELTVRTPNVNDAEALINQMKLVDCETKFLAREPGEFGFTVEQERAFITSSLKNENLYFIIGEVDNEIVGNCSVGRNSTQKRFLHRATMGIAIQKEYWNMGIGSILMNECINWCKANSIEQLELDVVTENQSALSMYLKFGFKIFGTKKHAMKYSDGTYADEYFMILFLN